MPREAVAQLAFTKNGRPDIVIGDRFGASAKSELVDEVEAIFAGAGFNVSRNAPFAGAYMVRHYGRPAKNHHAIQIEIDRSIYLDEETVKPNGNFGAIKAAMKDIVGQIAELGRQKRQMAAE